MSRFSFLDNRYNDLSANEKIRQVERDNLLYEQTEAINRITNNNHTSDEMITTFVNSSSFNFLALWFGIFTMGGLIVLILYIVNKDYNLGLGHLPIYIYSGILIFLIAVKLLSSLLKSILNCIANIISGTLIGLKKPKLEKELKELQKELGTLEVDIKYRKSRIQSLEVKSVFDDTVLEEIKRLQEELFDYEDKYIQISKRECNLRYTLQK